jgi:translation initiation factor IF-3
VDSTGEQLGVMPLKEALLAAEAQGLDLVEVAPNADPPVCKIMDYGKYRYQQSKRSQEAKKKQATIQVKEIKIRPKIEEHDLQFKLNNVRRFISEKNKTKISVIFRGREMAYTDMGLKVLTRIAEELVNEAQIEQAPKLEGRNMTMVLAPK